MRVIIEIHVLAHELIFVASNCLQEIAWFYIIYKGFLLVVDRGGHQDVFQGDGQSDLVHVLEVLGEPLELNFSYGDT